MHTFYNFVFISDFLDKFCEPIVKGKTSQALQLLHETLHTVKIIIFEHSSQVKYTEFLLARCLSSSENLNGPLVFELCTFKVGTHDGTSPCD